MIKRSMVKLIHCLSLKESWVIFFVLGIVMMNYPFLGIFNKAANFFNIPLLYLYFYTGWLVSIVVIFIFTRVIRNHPTNGNVRRPHEAPDK